MKYTLGNEDSLVISDLIDRRVHNPKHRCVLKLRFIDGLTYKEIADSAMVEINSERQIGKIIADYAPMLSELIKIS